MKNMIRAVCLLLALAFLAPAQAATEVQAQEGVTRIINLFWAKKQQIKGSSNLDIPLACLGEVYSAWYVNYISTLEQEKNLTLDAVQAVPKFTQNFEQHKEDRDVYDLLRPNVLYAIDEILITENMNPNNAPRTSLSNVQQAFYEPILDTCLDPEFIETVAQRAPFGNLDIMAEIDAVDVNTVPVDYSVESSEPVLGGSVAIVAPAYEISNAKMKVVKSDIKISVLDWIIKTREGR